MRKLIYKITVTNWAKHNSSKKKGHRSVLISTGFLSDPKVRQLTPGGKLLFLSCILLAGESTQSQFEVTHESLCFQCGVRSGSLQSHLTQLVELQLVTIENFDVFKNRIEENRIEEKLVDSYESTTAVAENSASAVVVRLPKKPSTFEPRDENEMLSGLRPATLARWAKLYSDSEFLRRESIKAFGYYENNPKKTPKTVRGWSQALSSWFDRAWPRHVRQIESVANAGLSEGQFNSIFQEAAE